MRDATDACLLAARLRREDANAPAAAGHPPVFGVFIGLIVRG